MADGPTALPAGGILAGGAGARFGGQDKGWVLLRGQPLVALTLSALRPQVGEVLVSANRHLERYAALGARVLADTRPGTHEGPLAGMVALLQAASTDWLLCVPVDACELPADLGQRLAAAAQGQGADIAVLADGEGLHPTFCLIRSALAADARASFEAGERAPRRWFARHRLARVQGPTPLNINTPEALAALESRP